MTDIIAQEQTEAPASDAPKHSSLEQIPSRWGAGRRKAKQGKFNSGRIAAIRDWSLIGLLIAVTILAFVGPLFAPFDPVQPVAAPKLPLFSENHLLGTDGIGRDAFSRVLVGLRTSWLLAIVVTTLGLIIGTVVGVLAGMFGGWVDTLLMRLTDVFLSLPSMLVAIAVSAALGSGLSNTVLAILVVWWPYYARIIRGEVRALVTRPHVEAARMAGASWFGIMWRHVLPGVVPTAIVTASLDIGNVVMTIASLSFLGLGQPAPAPELGADTSRNLSELLSAWWIPIVPGITVMLLSLLSNISGDAIRNRLVRR